MLELILVKPFNNFKLGDIINVKDGYARNFLIPQKIAIRSNKKNREFFEQKRKELEAQFLESKKKAEGLSKLIDGKDFTFIVQASDDGILFGSINNKQIAKVINNKFTDINVSYNKVELSCPIKKTGVYEVSLALHHEVKVSVLINIARSDSEASDALKLYNDSLPKNLSNQDQSENEEEKSNQQDQKENKDN